MPTTPATPPVGYRLVDLDEERLDDLLDLETWTFPSPHSIADLRVSPISLTWSRVRGVEDEDSAELVGMHASHPFGRFPVPGSTIPVSGLTWVGVHPGHRRRGLLRAMIDDHFGRTLARGEAVSALTASEPAIYGRFGYGMASQVVSLSLSRGAALHPVPGAERVQVSAETWDFDRHQELVAGVHLAAGVAAPNRPGWATRETSALHHAFLDDSPIGRDGLEARRLLVARIDGHPTGYAMFRRRLEWKDGTAAGTVGVNETVALDPASAHALWSRLLDLDLMSTIEVAQLLPDDALLGLLVDVRAARPRLCDNVWIRLLDVPAALAGRQYASQLDTVLAVTDEQVPANNGCWRITADAFSAQVSVTRTQAPADLRIGVADLGSLYLGGGSAAALAAAGRLTATSGGALARFATAVGWPVAPGTSWIF